MTQEASAPKERIFHAWAPSESLWSAWVKPVLFASMNYEPQPQERKAIDTGWVRDNDPSTAYVLDLPGASGVWAGVDLALKGYRPVPLYNALPSPRGDYSSSLEVRLSISQVNMGPIIAALWHEADRLEGIRLPQGAPPVFILDWNRRTGTDKVELGDFDNRSISFPTDFPSANFLKSQHISRVVVIQPEGQVPQEDLSQTLRRWQEAGIKIELKLTVNHSAPVLCNIPKPTWFRTVWLHAIAIFSRHSGGGFGRIIGESAGG